MTTKARFLSIGLFALFITGAYILILQRGMTSGYNHDENQFIASAYLFTTRRLLPYVDYPYFHTPNLVFVYAVLFRYTAFKLLIARYFSVLCATALTAGLFWWTFALFRKHTASIRGLMAFSAALLLLADPLFAYTAGRAWNHDASTLLSVLAVFSLLHAYRSGNRRIWLFVSGALLGLAIGTRSVWAASVPAFLLFIWLNRGGKSRDQMFGEIAGLGLGGLLSMAPSLGLALLAPEQFWFGNVGYARLNTLYRAQTGFSESMSLGTKWAYFLDLPEIGFWLLLIPTVYFVFLLPALRYLQTKKAHPELVFLAVLLLLTMAGALLPTPSFRQYFYALVPLSIIGIMRQVAEVAHPESNADHPGWATGLVLVVTVFACLRGLGDFQTAWQADREGTWFPLHVHWTGEKIAARIPEGKILTLAPIFVVEAGRDIYPQLASGPFAWRTSGLLPQQSRSPLDMSGPDELGALVRDTPPEGILIGWEPDLEDPLEALALKLGYRNRTISGKLELWLPE